MSICLSPEPFFPPLYCWIRLQFFKDKVGESLSQWGLSVPVPPIALILVPFSGGMTIREASNCLGSLHMLSSHHLLPGESDCDDALCADTHLSEASGLRELVKDRIRKFIGD